MTSLRQIEANRRNALKSTGPATPEGKHRSRCNAVRHGLTAETVIAVLENSEDYEAFEAAVISDYDAETATERELVLRLASVLWRLRRATGMETAIFDSVTEDSRFLFRKPDQPLNFDPKAIRARRLLLPEIYLRIWCGYGQAAEPPRRLNSHNLLIYWCGRRDSNPDGKSPKGF